MKSYLERSSIKSERNSTQLGSPDPIPVQVKKDFLPKISIPENVEKSENVPKKNDFGVEVSKTQVQERVGSSNLLSEKFSSVPTIKRSFPLSPNLEGHQSINLNRSVYRPIFNISKETPRNIFPLQNIKKPCEFGQTCFYPVRKSLNPCHTNFFAQTRNSDFRLLTGKRSSFEINESTDESRADSMRSLKHQKLIPKIRKGSRFIARIDEARMEISDGKNKNVFHYNSQKKSRCDFDSRLESFGLGFGSKMKKRIYRGSFHLGSKKRVSVAQENVKSGSQEREMQKSSSEISDKGINFGNMVSLYKKIPLKNFFML